MQIVQSVDRTLSILELLADYDDGLRIMEISDKVGLHKSTVHRLLSTLAYKGYVVQDLDTNKYKLTLKLFELGSKRIKDIDILSASKPYTKALMEKINEIVHLVIQDGNEIVYIDKVEADNTIRMASNIGKRSPMYSTSVGKAMLAFMEEDEVEEIWNNSEIEKFTEYTITDLDDLKDKLKEIRERGYSVDDQENELGVRCIGAPVFNRFGKVEGAISISGPTIRVTEEKVEEIAREVIKYANMISNELGYIK
ncbi:IclR family transcriptional regulator [Anaerosalibacter bizertensis]|uniref:Glycerol operon regulatory protein n=1 Tax=Anaerosalibacter bizertensis TaxID=932217 RepID=A0A844FKF4_9FIRM|nr:IclR family transcriptional regulator [Anaerosalibacter bizertensis]MBU5294131.1 IclR family transcriptional regulator [Anaerosalibacter bizertensis]MSS44366.1 IclR family transcriptional regulator [Anaerosalibacter bizertensis]